MIAPNSCADASTAARRCNAVALSILSTAMLFGGLIPANAQTAKESARKWELVISSGSLEPTGSQRGFLKASDVTLASLSYVLRPNLALTGSLGWARSKDSSLPNSPKLDVLMYDMGAELRGSRLDIGRGLSFGTFAGAGLGARNYRHRDSALADDHAPAAYLSVGGEFGYRGVRARLEARNYLTGYNTTGKSYEARNDLVLMFGLRLVD